MAFKLAAYGFAVGFLYSGAKKNSLFGLYLSIVAAMLAGGTRPVSAHLVIMQIG